MVVEEAAGGLASAVDVVPTADEKDVSAAEWETDTRVVLVEWCARLDEKALANSRHEAAGTVAAHVKAVETLTSMAAAASEAHVAREVGILRAEGA